MGRRARKDTPFRTILCNFMKAEGLSVREAAKIAQVPPSTLANWRAGAMPDDHFALRRLAEHFGVTLGYLLTGEPDLHVNGPPEREAMVHEGKILFKGYAKIIVQEILPRMKK